MKQYEEYMKKCIELAKSAEGKTSPNPLVGCVVLDKNGTEISSGIHENYGYPHAEANALNKLSDEETNGGTLFVNLEPCSHWGKTPPCADLIIKKGIKKLIIGMQDPNPLVSGKGILKCQNAGIEVIKEVLKEDCIKLNEIFIKNMVKKAIFVALKTASTLDGKIATKTGSSKWITSSPARQEVQRIRNRYDAILTTSSTIIKDNPSMNCRLENGKILKKIILDRELKTDFQSKIYNTDGEIYLVIDENIDAKRILAIPENIKIIKCKTHENKLDLDFLFKQLFELRIMSVLVEAGAKLNGEIISAGFADKIYQFIAPKIIADKNALDAYEGREIEDITDSINLKIDNLQKFGPDILITLYP